MLLKQTNTISTRYDSDAARRLAECDDVYFFTEGGSRYVSGFKGQTRMVYSHLSEAEFRRLQGIPDPSPYDDRWNDRYEHATQDDMDESEPSSRPRP